MRATDVIDLIARQLDVEPRRVTACARFVADLDADSMKLTELMLALEEHYDIEISADDALRLVTLMDVVGFVDRQVELVSARPGKTPRDGVISPTQANGTC
jgi:acyl carrier protein